MFSKVQKINTDKKIALLGKLFSQREKVLDFGCGDLSLGEALYQYNPSLQFTGIDIVDFKKRPENISFKKYNGKKIPFQANAFDTVLIHQVLHHCKDTEATFRECLRVSKGRLIITEPIYRAKVEIFGMKCMDWFWNIWKGERINLPYRFYSLNEWHEIFKKNNIKVVQEKNVDKFLPRWLPIGRTYLFILEKKTNRYCRNFILLID